MKLAFVLVLAACSALGASACKTAPAVVADVPVPKLLPFQGKSEDTGPKLYGRDGGVVSAAQPGSVARMIVREGGVVAGAGIVAGLATAFAGSRLIESLLYGISPRDPAVFASTTAILLAVALPACWFPARRAARLSPLEALRMD